LLFYYCIIIVSAGTAVASSQPRSTISCVLVGDFDVDKESLLVALTSVDSEHTRCVCIR
jgi:hypothetical protein